MITVIVILSIAFFVIMVGVALVACLRIAGLEDEELMREMEEKSIENADVFVHDGEPIGKVISIQDCKNGTSLINEEFQKCCKNITSLINEEFQSCTSLQNVKPTILGVDLAKEKENENGLDNN